VRSCGGKRDGRGGGAQVTQRQRRRTCQKFWSKNPSNRSNFSFQTQKLLGCMQNRISVFFGKRVCARGSPSLSSVAGHRSFARSLLCSLGSLVAVTARDLDLARKGHHARALLEDSFPRLAPTVCVTVCVAFNKRRDSTRNAFTPPLSLCRCIWQPGLFSADNRFEHLEHGHLPTGNQFICFIPDINASALLLTSLIGGACESVSDCWRIQTYDYVWCAPQHPTFKCKYAEQRDQHVCHVTNRR